MKRSIINIFEKILIQLINSRDRESFLFDLREIHKNIEGSKGKVYANSWYLFQVIKSFPPAIQNKMYWSFVMLKNYATVALRNFNKQKNYIP